MKTFEEDNSSFQNTLVSRERFGQTFGESDFHITTEMNWISQLQKKTLHQKTDDEVNFAASGTLPLDDSLWDSSSNSHSYNGKDPDDAHQEADSEEFEDANVSDEEADEKDMYES